MGWIVRCHLGWWGFQGGQFSVFIVCIYFYITSILHTVQDFGYTCSTSLQGYCRRSPWTESRLLSFGSRWASALGAAHSPQAVSANLKDSEWKVCVLNSIVWKFALCFQMLSDLKYFQIKFQSRYWNVCLSYVFTFLRFYVGSSSQQVSFPTFKNAATTTW